MRIYFAAAMRGGRGNLATNQQIAAYLAKRGHDVLTLHVTDDTFTQREADLTDREIYERDMKLLQQAEVVIAEATTPSLGVGYEIAAALHQGSPVLCLHRRDTNQPFSAMIAGITDPNFQLAPYTGDGWRRITAAFLNRQLSASHR